MLENHSPLGDPPVSSSGGAHENGGNVDRVLFKNLVEMVPLVESLMDRRANSSFTRRASLVYTPTPAQLRKDTDPRGRKIAQTASAKKRRDYGGSLPKGIDADLSIFSSRSSTAENGQKHRDELAMIREQVDDLQKKLLEKDEALKSAEDSMNQLNAAYVSLDELKRQVADKDAMVKSVNSQLYNAKIKLADNQAALEKLEWETKMSNRKVEELKDGAASMDLEITSLTMLFEELSKNDSVACQNDNTIPSYDFDPLPLTDGINVIEKEKMEKARTAYLAAVAAAKENPSEESLATATAARIQLQFFVL